MAEQPVKNWTKMTKNHIIVPPVLPPALKKICATGRPDGVPIIPSTSDMQKQNVTVSIQPTTPDTRIAVLIATGPLIAASCVSSDMLCNHIRFGDLQEVNILTGWCRHNLSLSTQQRGSCVS
jgi:hypothetical protein